MKLIINGKSVCISSSSVDDTDVLSGIPTEYISQGDYEQLTEEEKQSRNIIYLLGIGQGYYWWSPGMTGAESPDPYKVSASGVINSSAPYPWKAFDGNIQSVNVNNVWQIWMSPNIESWIEFDFGAKTEVTGLRLFPCASGASQSVEYRGYFPKVFTISGSDDEDAWDELFSSDGTDEFDPQKDPYRTCIFSNPVNYRYYRVDTQTNYSTTNSKIAVIQDIRFYRLMESGGSEYEFRYRGQEVSISKGTFYVDSYTTEDGWYVRKYDDGYVEMSIRKQVNISGFSASSTGMKYTSLMDSIALPITLTQKLGERVDILNNTCYGDVWPTIKHTSNDELSFTNTYTLCTNSQSISTGPNFIFSLTVVGLWK